MHRSLAQIVSFIVHPALMPILGTAMILILSPYHIQRPIFFLVIIYVFLGTYVFPLLMTLLLKKLQIISSIQMEKASERRYPYILTALFFYLTSQSLRNFPIPELAPKFLLAGVLTLGISFLTLSFSKVSAHLAGVGGLLGLALYISYTYNLQLLSLISLLILLSGLLGTSRLKLKAHNSTEIYSGFAIGLGSVFISLYFF